MITLTNQNGSYRMVLQPRCSEVYKPAITPWGLIRKAPNASRLREGWHRSSNDCEL